MNVAPVDLSRLFNCDRTNKPLSPEDGSPWSPGTAGPIRGLPGGCQVFWGVPFLLGPADDAAPCWLVLHDKGTASSIPVRGRATYLVLAHFCNACQDPRRPGDLTGVVLGHVVRPGEHIANYVLVYADGSKHVQPIRRRFEINNALVEFGSHAFAARSHWPDEAVDFRGPSPRNQWGRRQIGAVKGGQNAPGNPLIANYWIYALPNPFPERDLVALRIEPTGADTLAIAGLTLYSGKEHPLRQRRLETLKVTLTEASAPEAVPLAVDLGVVARKYAVPAFAPEEWLAGAVQGWGEQNLPAGPVREFFVDISAVADATLKIAEREVSLNDIYEAGEATSSDGRVRVDLVSPSREWLYLDVADATTGRPTPARIHFRSPDGRYWPPYGHRHEVNDNWFEDYGGDVKLGSTQYAYIDGSTQIELPAGEMYVEVSKGFEYEPLRRKIEVRPGQRELRLAIPRAEDMRRRGWVSADTHVHFISPETARLEAQGEGLNIVNLLAAGWGDLFTNICDYTGDLARCSQDDTLVWVGTENRQHLLGHLSLLGMQGKPVYPLVAGGPLEAYLGEPVWTTLAEWADSCHERGGLTVAPHFPHPYCEVVADIILGKIDAVELKDFRLPSPESLSVLQWYRFLNCGYRVAAVGGTDKMFASTAVGGIRTYAYIGDDEFSYSNWAKAVRGGRTFATTGPLIDFRVDGHRPGDEIRLPAGGGTLSVEATVRSVLPIQELQIVVNGKVAASAQADSDGHTGVLRSEVKVRGSAWIGARCWGPGMLWQIWPMCVSAHTSPVYVVAGEDQIFSPSDAAFMLTMLEGGITYLDTLSIRANPERHGRNLQVYQTAREQLHQRLHQRAHAERDTHHHLPPGSQT